MSVFTLHGNNVVILISVFIGQYISYTYIQIHIYRHQCICICCHLADLGHPGNLQLFQEVELFPDLTEEEVKLLPRRVVRRANEGGL